jgi:hypothetical protein
MLWSLCQSSSVLSAVHKTWGAEHGVYVPLLTDLNENMVTGVRPEATCVWLTFAVVLNCTPEEYD